MAAVFPIPYSKTFYSMKQDGLHIFVVYSRATVYILTWIAFFVLAISLLGFQGLNAYPNIIAGFVGMIPPIIVSTISTIVILSFGVFRLQSIQKLFHKEKLVLWDLIEKAELKKVGLVGPRATRVKIFLQSNNNLSIKGNTVEFFVTKGSENEVENFLNMTLSSRLIVKK